MPYVEQNLPGFMKGEIVDRERWSYGQVITVLRVLLSVDTVCFVPWFVYAASRYTHFVPSLSSVWRLDVSASVSSEREGPGDGNAGREPEGSVVPYLPYVPPRAEGRYRGARLVGLGTVNICSVSTVVPPVVAEAMREGSKKTYKGARWMRVYRMRHYVSSCAWNRCRR